MITNVTSLTGNGLRDWLWQRVSAIILAAYTVFLFIFYLNHQPLSYLQWHGLFANSPMRLANSIVLLNLLIHAWIGCWTVTTDYLKSTAIRVTVQVLIMLLLLAISLWGISIFWGF